MRLLITIFLLATFQHNLTYSANFNSNNNPYKQLDNNQQQHNNQQLISNQQILKLYLNNIHNIITRRIEFDTNLNHLVVDSITGVVYVGGINRLYQLSPELDLVETVITGPKNDSYDCTALECPGNTERQLTDNYNKVLLIDRTTSRSRLIFCGSIFQGLCTVRNLVNASIIEQEVFEAVVANNELSSTVAFIAPGPAQPTITNVMYVGVTYTDNSPYRSEIPAVASRSLEKSRMFQITSSDKTTGTRIYFNSYVRESYLVNYVYGFSSEGFSYFLTTQLKHVHHLAPKEYITKLVRICQEDSNYYSYTEIPVDCISDVEGGTKYNLIQSAYLGKPSSDLAENFTITEHDDVLYAVFSEGLGNNPTNKSALCIYSLKQIRRKFMQNIKTCFDGNGERGLDFISPNMLCVPTKLPTISEDFCGLDINSPLGGEQPIVALPVSIFDTLLTSVAATRTSGYTVVFIGTSDGHLKKVVVESASSANAYSDIIIDNNHRIYQDMQFDNQEMHIYVMSQRKVAKVKVHDCLVYKTCGECLGAKDPYCGWCSLENKCSIRSKCHDDANDPLYWLSYKSGKCTTITNVVPHQLHITTTRTLELIIDHLPQLKENLVCAFTIKEHTLFTNATKIPTGVNCSTPGTDMLPHIEHGKHHITAKLSVRTKNGPDLVSSDFKFFDCSTHSSCTRCVSSEFSCDWCFETHRCTHDTAENCRNDIHVTGVSRIGPSYRSGPSFCPTINPIGGGTEILVAAGTSKSIKVKVHITGQFIVQTRFVCQFNIEGRVTSLNAQLLSDTIYCDIMEFQYTSRSPNVTAPFAVIWGGSKPIDNPHNIHVVIYRCRDMSDSCGMCLALPEKYNCGWCSSTNSCEIEDQCNKNTEDKTDWLNRMQTCPNPGIHSFLQNTTPSESGTNITFDANFHNLVVDSTTDRVYQFSPKLTNVVPHQLQRTTARTLELIIDHLPQLKDNLVCAFTTKEQTLFTNAAKTRDGVNCSTPRTDMLPRIEQGKHHFTVKLSVRAKNGSDLVSTDFTFFDCSTHSSCTRCVSSEFPCDWCVEAHRCTHDTAENCRNDILVTDVSRIGPSYRSGPSFCPTINPIGGGTEILVAAGTSKSIKVKIHITGQFIVQTRFVCQFNIEGRVTSLNAQLLSDTIYCDIMEFQYTSRSPNVTAPFAVIWGGSKPIDNPHNIHVVIYRCRDMSDSCGMCLALPEKYNCGWCSSTNSCEIEDQCNKNTEDKTDWLNRMQTCPNPGIHSFLQNTTPSESGTNITFDANFHNLVVDSTTDRVYQFSPKLTNVVPHQLQRTTARTLELIIDHLPQFKDNLVCAFTTKEQTLFTNAAKTRDGVNCSTPRTDMLPRIEQGKHHFTVKLSVRAKNGSDLVSTDFTFFDCSTHSSCTRCVSSEFPCDWCVEAHRCTHDTAENCRNDILVTDVSRIGPSYRSGPSFCPTINPIGGGTEILVAAGTSKSIKVKIHITGQFIVQTRFVCQFNIEGRVTSLNAQLLSDTIYCDIMEFQYTSRSPNVTAPFAVIWGGSKPIDNPHNIHVVIYRCRDMSDSCGMCLALPEKYNCGWCSSTNSCEIEDQCNKNTEDKTDWLDRMQTCPNPGIDSVLQNTTPSESGTNITFDANFHNLVVDSTTDRVYQFSPKLTNVVPHQLQRTTARTLELIIDHLPQLKDNLVCAFTTKEQTLFTNATKTRNGVNCSTPRTDMLPRIEQGKHHFTVKLSVRAKNGSDLVSTDFTFFDCSTHSSCTRCVSSEFPCDWCVEAHRCTHDTAENCRNDILVTDVSRIGPSYRSGPSFCPTINPIGGGTEILVAAGTSKSIKVKIHITGQFIVQTRFVCQFNIEGRVTSLNAQLLSDTIYCDIMEFQYTSRSPNVTAPFAVIWGGSKPIDNPHNIHVVIYRCRDMSDSCGMCLALPEKYNCGWCSSTNSCEIEDQCNKNTEDKTDWLNRMQTCPNPGIHSFLQNTTPSESGTNITFDANFHNLVVDSTTDRVYQFSPKLTNVVPHQLQRTTARTLELIIDHLPQLKDNLVCAFTTKEQTLFTNAAKTRDGVNCSTPRTDMLPRIEQGKHHFTAKLSVRTKNGPDLVSTDFKFFDCSTHSSCTRCVSSEFPCDWCFEAHRCTHDTAENCRNDILVTGVSRIGPSYRSGPSFCPTINPIGGGTEILVAAGTSKSIKVKVHITGQFIVQTRFVCQFNIEGRVTSLNAQLLSDTIYCDIMEFQYTSRSPNVTAPFAVIWGGSKPIDNPHNIHVVIYRCRDMSDSCGMCLALPEKYNCGWCSSTNSCEIEDQCNKNTEDKTDWLNRMQTCTNPEIHSFITKTTPSESIANNTIRLL